MAMLRETPSNARVLKLLVRYRERAVAITTMKSKRRTLKLITLLITLLNNLIPMNKYGFAVIILLFGSVNCSDSSLYKLVLHSTENGAACLDGSKAGLYIHQGLGQNKNKFMIHFKSGGFCGGDTLADTIQSCYERSMTDLGTTDVEKPFRSFDGQGVLSTKAEENPIFYDWTKIFAIYCDGAAHQGYRQNPITFKGKKIYFRGTRNVMEHFRYLEKNYDFYNGETIVITGVSAGGLATYQWSNYLYDHAITAKVYAIPDSGFFITDYYSPIVDAKVVEQRIQNLLKLVSTESEMELPDPIKLCLLEGKYEYAGCFNAGNYAKYLRAPMLIVESPYDEWSLNNILVVKCLKNARPPYSLSACNDTTRAAIESYKNESLKYLMAMKNDRDDFGVWAPACVQHGFSDVNSLTNSKFKAPNSNGLTLNEAIKQFLQNPQTAPWLLDESAWPTNTACSGQGNDRHKAKRLK